VAVNKELIQTQVNLSKDTRQFFKLALRNHDIRVARPVLLVYLDLTGLRPTLMNRKPMRHKPSTQFQQRVKTLGVAALFVLFGNLHAESLYGRVVDRASISDSLRGAGISGVHLSLYNADGKRIASKVTSKAGAFQFQRLVPGTFTLTLERGGYLPKKAIHVFTLGLEDTSRDVYLDRIPAPAKPSRKLAKKKITTQDYYARLATGILKAGNQPGFFRESTDSGRATLSRFFDSEEDTTEGYRRLWMALLWTEIENQDRPVENLVYLAHALDTALKTESAPELPALKPYVAVAPDSVEALSRALPLMILSPKKNPPESMTKYRVPKSMVLAMAETRVQSKAFALTKRKAFVANLSKIYGAAATREMLASLSPPKKIKTHLPQKPEAPPTVNDDIFWKVVAQQAVGTRPNPVALYHLARRRF
jgi:hypothetical protein